MEIYISSLNFIIMQNCHNKKIKIIVKRIEIKVGKFQKILNLPIFMVEN